MNKTIFAPIASLALLAGCGSTNQTQQEATAINFADRASMLDQSAQPNDVVHGHIFNQVSDAGGSAVLEFDNFAACVKLITLNAYSNREITCIRKRDGAGFVSRLG